MHRKPTWLLYMLACLVALSAGLAHPQHDSQSETKLAIVDSDLFLLGTFDSYTSDTVIRKLEANPDITRLVLTANGGSIDDRDTLRLGRYIRAQRLNTHIVAKGVAASGGVSLFLAGVERSVGAGAFVGVHAWAQCSRHGSHNQCKPATEFERGNDAHDLHRDYIVEMLSDEAFYWFSINSAAHNSIHWLSEEELHQFQVVTTDDEINLSIPFADAFFAEYEQTCHNCPK
ncbi:MAG: hypothetical protein JJU03_00305 [Idiomarina sp.]|nr:hypothetical protein [Idiomarina sp.]